MIDLHTHTDQSDGSYSAHELVAAAVEAKIEALAITDHDTFSGYDLAIPYAAAKGLDLICGIELATKYRGRSVHLLAYFLKTQPTDEFRSWVVELQESRHERNRLLIEKLRSRGIEVTIEDIRSRAKKLVGRPHFASFLVEKGYAASIQEAFDEYLDESAPCFVSRQEPDLGEAIKKILAAKGLPSLPHPGRLSMDRNVLETYLRELQPLGLKGLEVYHSDHTINDTTFYASLARRLLLAASGGTDFHGATKSSVALGTGINGNVNVPRAVLDELRRIA